MAVSSSAVALYIARRGPPLPTPRHVFVPSKPTPRLFIVRSTVETGAEGGAADPDSSIEVPQGPPSLISALNVERALRGLPITDVDHYGRLGLSRDCSADQVVDAYKSKTQELLSQELDLETLNPKLEMLKESFTILSTPEEKRLYDWSLARTEVTDRYVWPFEVDNTKQSPEEPPPVQEPEDLGPTIALGYFFLGWIILSAILSIALNLRNQP